MIAQEEKFEIIKKFAKSPNDTGSCEVQIGLITQRIEQIAGHLQLFKKDYHSRRGLVNLVEKRRTFLKYLAKNNKQSFDHVTQLIKQKTKK